MKIKTAGMVLIASNMFLVTEVYYQLENFLFNLSYIVID